MPLTPSATRALLAQLGHHPRHFLGQNFLVDGNIVQKSLELAQIAAGECVVEIGPGLGTLTEALLAAGARVWAVEKDTTLHAYLNSSLVPRYPKTAHLILGDAVEHPLADWAESPTPFKVVANLPYAIATPWLDAVLSGPLPIRLVLMLQDEAAQRYAAHPGGKSFGAISVFLQAAYDVGPGHRVAAACFHPRPDIDSRLFTLVLKATPYVFPADCKLFIRSCFQQRRKQIGALIRGRLPENGKGWLEHLESAGLSSRARPESIPASSWVQLVKWLAPAA